MLLGQLVLPLTLNPPTWPHEHSQGQQTHNKQKKDKGQDEKERATHIGKHLDSPPSIRGPTLVHTSYRMIPLPVAILKIPFIVPMMNTQSVSGQGHYAVAGWL
ncbi:MAG: hypothetical protein HXY51_12690 [Nitrospirae bacterium]|nr:hypothetical protein [Nitrospirota bacterium]